MADTEPALSRRQLPLEVRLRDDATFGNFFALSSHGPLLEVLKQQLASGEEHLVYLYGSAGTGKTHLLQACCQSQGYAELYLPLAELARYSPDAVLQGVTDMQRICLDDLQAISGNRAWEEALFHLCNRAREQGCALVVAADASPRALGLHLADLQSRLSAGLVLQLARPDDRVKAEILRFRAQRRGLTLGADTASFIVARAPRSLDQLLALLDRLDHASLAEQRGLSIPFVKSVLGW